MASAVGTRWLPVAWVAWIALAAVAVALPLAGAPLVYTQLHGLCPDGTACPDTGQLTPDGPRALQALGLSLGLYAALSVAVPASAAAVWIVVGALVVWRRPRDPIALLTSGFLLCGSVGVADGSLRDAAAAANPGWAVASTAVHALAAVAFGLVLALFPDGRWVPGWTRWLVLGWGGLILPHVVSPWPPALLLPALFALIGASVYAQVWRYRRGSDAVQRQQIKWAVLGLCGALGGWFVAEAVGYLVFPDLLRPGSPWVLLFSIALRAVWILAPLSIGAAVLHSRLWDVEPIVHRTLVYGALTAAVAGLYVLVVGSFALLLQAGENPLVGLLATGLAAILFQPLRARLQRGVNRLLYGRRDEPYYSLLSQLGRRLEGTLAPEAVLTTIVQIVAEGLRLPYVAIVLGAGSSAEVAAAQGTATTPVDRRPLIYQTEVVGELLVAPRTAGETFSVADSRLLDDLARQAGVAVHAVRLTRDLRLVAIDLQQARERLVAGREEERRRLRRDLHDGIGPTLASLVQRLDAASRLASRDPEAAAAVLADMKIQARETVAEVRELVYALRPPALDQLGLVSAISEHAAQHLEPTGLRVSVEAPSPFPPLPAAVEVAAYRIVVEALTNVARHADARSCGVRLAPGPDALLIDVVDDGRGFPSGARDGVGLASMGERAAELGGECVVERPSAGGTRVRARLPRPRAEQA